MRSHEWRRPVAAIVALAVVTPAWGCGGHGAAKPSAGTLAKAGSFLAPAIGKRGGHLTVLNAGDVDYLDPGLTYYGPGWQVAYATNRPLYSFKAGPIDGQPVPDLASGPPQISSDARTITVHIRPGIRFSPPVGRAVTSHDVKYAIERAFTKQVPNGYAASYFSSIVGAPKAGAPGYRPIPGIQTPDDQTLVLKLDQPARRP